MSQVKVGSRIVFVPSKYFPNDSIETGIIVGRARNNNHFIGYQILWDNGKQNIIPEYLITSGQIKVFSNQKKALAFLLSVA